MAAEVSPSLVREDYREAVEYVVSEFKKDLYKLFEETSIPQAERTEFFIGVVGSLVLDAFANIPAKGGLPINRLELMNVFIDALRMDLQVVMGQRAGKIADQEKGKVV